MFKPSPVLAARLRLTTKQVNGGYYKGNRTGSMGAHTEYGQYIIDYRKTRHYNMPDLSKCELTPFVTKEMEPTKWEKSRSDGTTFEPPKVDGMELLKSWHDLARGEYDWWVAEEETAREAKRSQEQQNASGTQSQEQILAKEPGRS
jgi:large subunit ribosomal protein L41